jgi:hypothetical protein
MFDKELIINSRKMNKTSERFWTSRDAQSRPSKNQKTPKKWGKGANSCKIRTSSDVRARPETPVDGHDKTSLDVTGRHWTSLDVTRTSMLYTFGGKGGETKLAEMAMPAQSHLATATPGATPIFHCSPASLKLAQRHVDRFLIVYWTMGAHRRHRTSSDVHGRP